IPMSTTVHTQPLSGLVLAVPRIRSVADQRFLPPGFPSRHNSSLVQVSQEKSLARATPPELFHLRDELRILLDGEHGSGPHAFESLTGRLQRVAHPRRVPHLELADPAPPVQGNRAADPRPLPDSEA